MTYAPLSPANLQKCRDKHGDKYTYHSYCPKTRKLKYACPVHGDKEQFIAAHCRGTGCFDCAVSSRLMSLDEFTVKARKVHGDKYSYDSVFPKGRQQAVIVCSEHGKFEQSCNSHLAGNGCKKCGINSRVIKNSYTTEELLKRAGITHENKYAYPEQDLKNIRSKLSAVCPEHGAFTVAAYLHIYGRGCSKCGIARGADVRRYSFETMVEKASAVHNNKYTYLKATTDQPPVLHIVCPQHGEFTQNFNSHHMGSGCSKCANEANGRSKRHTFPELVGRVQQVHDNLYTYKELSYETGRPILTSICSKHGEFKQWAGDYLAGHGCNVCSPRVTGPTLEIKEFLESRGLTTELEAVLPSNTRKRLDILIPSLRLAVEYHGNYWHSSKFRKDNYHIDKHKLAGSDGIRIIHIMSSEWNNKKEIVKSILAAACGVNKDKLYARKLKTCEVSKEQAVEFYNAYHIQGKPQSGQFVGLRHGDELVAVMAFSFNTSDRKTKATENLVELTRYATKVNVVGGFTRLLKYWLKANPSVEQVSSYSDVRLYSGKTYKLAGFEEAYTTKPNYKYLENGDVLRHKSNYQKSKLVQRFGAEACAGKTERQITEEQGLYRVYDCGLTKWVLNVKR